MPLTTGILIGVVAVAVGVAMSLGTTQKKVAMIVICVGLCVAQLTLGVVVSAINSGM